MKSKKVKLVTSLLSVGALSAILIPTITLTSCSATANPYISEFTCKDSTINGQQMTFVAKFADANQLSDAYFTTADGKKFDINSFTKTWDEIKKTEAGKDLPASIWEVNKPIDNAQVKEIVNNQNYLTLFSSVMNNLKSIYENYNTLFISKNPNIISVSDEQLTKGNKFFKFMLEGLNESSSYARLWLSDIQFTLTGYQNQEIGKETTEEQKNKDNGFHVALSNIKLNYNWFELGDKGSTIIDKWDNLQKYKNVFDQNPDNAKHNVKLEPKDLSFSFNVVDSMDLYFSNQYSKAYPTQNGDKTENKYYTIGLIAPNGNKPLSFNFSGDEDQKRRKTDFFNKEVLRLIKNKLVTENELNELYRQVGYLLNTDFPNKDNDNIPMGDDATNKTNIESGKTFINKLVGGQ